MQLNNGTYFVYITADETYSLKSTDNKPYDYVFNPDTLTRRDITKVFSIKIFNGLDEPKNIALIGSLYSYVKDCAVLDDNKLIVLMNTAITVIDLESLKLTDHKIFSDFGCYFSLYAFDNGYLVYGELDIVKFNKDFEIVWKFSGADVFVSADNSTIPFNINGDTIELYDWNGNFYHLDKSGMQINRVI